MEIDKIRRLIAESKLDRAIKKINEDIGNYPGMRNQLITLSSNFNELRNKENMGLLEEREIFKSRSQVSMALLELLNEIESTDNIPATDSLNTIAKAVSNTPTPKKVFISYNHHDLEKANRLRDKLLAENIEVYIDSDKMEAGEDIQEFIEKCVRETNATISLISKNSLLSAWVAMESINTFYHEKTDSAKKFIACYITDDFFKRTFTDDAFDYIDGEIKDIQSIITLRMTKNRSIRDLQNELTRMTELRNNIDEIVRRLRESLCVDIKDDNIDHNFQKILQTIIT